MSRLRGVRAARRNPERKARRTSTTKPSKPKLAGRLGVEPRQSAPKALDLPLADRPSSLPGLRRKRLRPPGSPTRASRGGVARPQVRAIRRRSPFASPTPYSTFQIARDVGDQGTPPRSSQDLKDLQEPSQGIALQRVQITRLPNYPITQSCLPSLFIPRSKGLTGIIPRHRTRRGFNYPITKLPD